MTIFKPRMCFFPDCESQLFFKMAPAFSFFNVKIFASLLLGLTIIIMIINSTEGKKME